MLRRASSEDGLDLPPAVMSVLQLVLLSSSSCLKHSQALSALDNLMKIGALAAVQTSLQGADLDHLLRQRRSKIELPY